MCIRVWCQLSVCCHGHTLAYWIGAFVRVYVELVLSLLIIIIAATVCAFYYYELRLDTHYEVSSEFLYKNSTQQLKQ